MIKDAAKIIVTPTGIIDEALSDEYLEKLNAEAERVKADATAYANAKMAQNLNVELKLKELEIEKLRVEKWDGHYVPTNNYGPIPVQSGSIQGESKR